MRVKVPKNKAGVRYLVPTKQGDSQFQFSNGVIAGCYGIDYLNHSAMLNIKQNFDSDWLMDRYSIQYRIACFIYVGFNRAANFINEMEFI